MGFIIVVFKILFMLASVFFMFLPLISEYCSYRRDCKKGLSHKRFRLAVFSLIYAAGITVAMTFLSELSSQIGSWSWVAWLANKISIPGRLTYCVKIIAIMLINLAIGALFRLLIPIVRSGLKKKDLSKPKKDGEFSWLQKIERKILKYFNDEKWFFAGTILKFLNFSLAAVYACAFIFCLLPVFFGAKWIPYGYIVRLLESGYIYPILTLIPLCEAYFFLAGVENLESECPDFESTEKSGTLTITKTDIKLVRDECKKHFKDYFVQELEDITAENEVAFSGSYHAVTKLIAEGIENNSRNPKPTREGYLRALNTIVENDLGPKGETVGEGVHGVLVNGSFFTGFSEYFLRYCSVILARGDNILFICNDNSQIEQTYQLVVHTFEQLYSLYHTEAVNQDVNFEDPVWKIVKINSASDESECAEVNNCSVLITDLNFLTTDCFERRCDTFVHLIDTIVVVDALGAVNHFSRQMSVFDTKVKNMRELNATRARNSMKKKNSSRVEKNRKNAFSIRYTNNQIKYVCFDDSRIPGLDKVLKNLLYVDFISADSMRYSSQTVVCCYNFDKRADFNGESSQLQSAYTEERLGVLVNIADFAANLGAGRISLFAESNIPFRDLMESIDANANHGLHIQNGVNLFVNTYQCDFDKCRVIVAFDHNDNLPMIIRRLRTMTSDRETLVMIFSRPYMFRDYYQASIEHLWKSEQMMRIPVEEGGKHSAIQKILVKANSGGIPVNEIFDIISNARLEDYADILNKRDICSLLRKILLDCGKHQNDACMWNDYFEFVQFNDFDNRGSFVIEERIRLRTKQVLGQLLDNVSPAKAVIDDKEYPLTISKNRITQNYIVGQNMLYDGCIYVINVIDVEKGRLFIKHASGGRNDVPYGYVQNREYHIDYSDPAPERPYSTKQVNFNGSGEMNVRNAKISVTKRPMEVITRGYYTVDNNTMNINDTADDGYFSIDHVEQSDKFKQTYRRYGELQKPVCSSEMLARSNVSHFSSPNNAKVMSVKLSGEFGSDPTRMVVLATVMLNETLRTMFPSVADSVVVCPVLDTGKFEDKEFAGIFGKLPKAYCREYNANPEDIELLIIEDCDSDLGVISVLMSSGDNVLKMLFQPVYEYLNWYLNSDVKSDYLNFGMPDVPECFDFENLFKLVSVLGKDEFSIKFVDIETPLAYDVCDFCGKRYAKGTDVMLLEDGRKMCKACAGSLVDNDKKVLKAYLDRARIFLESTYGITLDDDYEFCFDSTVKIANTLKQNRNIKRRGYDIPIRSYVDDEKKVHIEYSIPSANLSELLVRELTHVWQLKHIPNVSEDLAEGHIALVAIQYLKFLNQSALASARTTYYETTANISGEGYRKLIRALLENPQFNNNPFRYLAGEAGGGSEEGIVPPTPRIIDSGDFGLPYTAEHPDRALDGNLVYFYYNRLTATHQKAYNVLLMAIQKHENSVNVDGCKFKDVDKIMDAIAFDHPELFWYKTFSMGGSEVHLHYGASAEESELLQKRMDEVVPKYLEGIDDSMSAYDVALRIYVRLIAEVDYDTIALEKEKSTGGPEKDKIDYLRTMCGVFLDKKAVCEGYARALQYLLQKCGVECAEAAGYVYKDTGERSGAHAWNILKIDGDYYYMDVTWDDSSKTVDVVKSTDPSFDYFCITTDELRRTRDLVLCPVDMPICDATRGNYFHHNGYVLDSYDLNKLKEIAQIAAKNKGKMFMFKCDSKVLRSQAMSQLFDPGDDCYEVLKVAAKIDRQICDNRYSYSNNGSIWTVTVRFKYKEK